VVRPTDEADRAGGLVMRRRFGTLVEGGRQRTGPRASEPGDTRGWFLLQNGRTGRRFKVLVGDGLGWDHVSVSTPSARLPCWDDMCWIKSLFFEPGECVVQYHPPAATYVNHGEVLHLWRPQEAEIPMPPEVCV